MMPRWLWFVPLAALIAALGLWAFRLGVIAATITQTDVIETYAAEYTANFGASARVTDCMGRPGARKGVWIVVRCKAPDGTLHVYPVNRYGRLLRISPEPEAVDGPET